MSYCTVAEVRTSIGSINSPAVANGVIEDAIEAADSLIDGYIGAVYTVPLSSVPYMIRRISRDIAVWHTFNDMIASGASIQDDEKVEMRYKEAIRLLKQLRDGEIVLAGATAAASTRRRLWSSTKNYKPVFDMDDDTKWGADSDMLDDIDDERDAAESVLPQSHS